MSDYGTDCKITANSLNHKTLRRKNVVFACNLRTNRINLLPIISNNEQLKHRILIHLLFIIITWVRYKQRHAGHPSVPEGLTYWNLLGALLIYMYSPNLRIYKLFSPSPDENVLWQLIRGFPLYFCTKASSLYWYNCFTAVKQKFHCADTKVSPQWN